jgi:hypothetical protein
MDSSPEGIESLPNDSPVLSPLLCSPSRKSEKSFSNHYQVLLSSVGQIVCKHADAALIHNSITSPEGLLRPLSREKYTSNSNPLRHNLRPAIKMPHALLIKMPRALPIKMPHALLIKMPHARPADQNLLNPRCLSILAATDGRDWCVSPRYSRPLLSRSACRHMRH